MVKKKSTRQKHPTDPSVGDTSDEEIKDANFQGKVCQHISRGLNFARVKRSLKAVDITICGGCTDVNVSQDDLPEVWLCLQCGNRGCGRMSINKHAIQHFKTIHSDCHALVLSTSSGVVWCYECDDEVRLQQSRNLRQSVEFFNKQRSNKNNMNGHKSPTNSQNSLKIVIDEEAPPNKSVETKSSESKPVNKIRREIPLPKMCIKGLRNLGNTCFFNAVMQNLNQTHLLHQVLDKISAPDYVWEIPLLTSGEDSVVETTKDEILKIPIPRQFSLASNLLNFYKLMNTTSTNKNEIVNPNGLFSEIARKCPQFKHFQEQDSHELLRQLLDGLRQDEVKRQKKAILRHFDISNVPIEEVDEETKKLIKAYGCYASHTLVEKIFGGLFISTILCEECKMSSQVFEPFMDISLPLFEEKQQDTSYQPYLDGGQKQDFEPLRNRKTNGNHEEKDEYVLNKPKKDFGKLSKHQLRKMKDIARKEKKKKNLKGKKNDSVEESAPCNEEIEEGKENIEILDFAETEHKEKSDEESLDNELEKTQSFDTEHQEIKTPSKCSEILKDNDIVPTEVEIMSSEDSKNLEGKNENNLKPTSLNEVHTVQSELNKDLNSEISGSEVDINFQDNDNRLSKTCEEVNDANAVLKNSDLAKGDSTEHSNSSLITMADESGESGFFNSILGDLLVDEIPNQTSPCEFESEIIIYEDISLPLPTDSQSNLKYNGGITNNTDDVKTDSEIKHSGIEASQADQSLENLTKDFESMTISAVDDLESDQRMQALGMQVREVRIRKDSDRQDSILDSSRSPCDETNSASSDSREDTCDNECDKNWSCSFSNNQVKEWILKSLLTLKPRVHISANECSVDSCLTYFTKPELLTGSNKFRCEKCTEIKISKTGNKKDVAYSNASKQLLIFSPPAILTLHLKRFQQVNMSLRKVNRFVEFPLVLDLAPYCSSACSILPHVASVKDEILYSLYGVVEHSGRLSSGHYTAYVKVAKRTLIESFMCHLPLAQCDLEQLFEKFSKNNTEKTDGSEPGSSSDSRHWYYVSDAHVREVDESQVLKCQAYLLFYERIK